MPPLCAMPQVHIDVEEGGDTGEARYGGTPERLAHHVLSPTSEMSSSSARCQRQMSDQDKMFQRQILNALDREYNAREGALKRSALFQGLLCIAAVVFLWVSASELIREAPMPFSTGAFAGMTSTALTGLDSCLSAVKQLGLSIWVDFLHLNVASCASLILCPHPSKQPSRQITRKTAKSTSRNTRTCHLN